jgi:hypothetical protein
MALIAGTVKGMIPEVGISSFSHRGRSTAQITRLVYSSENKVGHRTLEGCIRDAGESGVAPKVSLLGSLETPRS